MILKNSLTQMKIPVLVAKVITKGSLIKNFTLLLKNYKIYRTKIKARANSLGIKGNLYKTSSKKKIIVWSPKIIL
jgi:hypothetical protein